MPERILVDKEQVVKDGIRYYRLYFFDTQSGATIMYDSMIFVSTSNPMKDVANELKEIPKEPVAEVAPQVQTPVVDVINAI